jgi:uncharacterized protein YjbI with pentapeptide repeats
MTAAFMGKFAFQSTNATGPAFYLTLVDSPGQDPLASMSSASLVPWVAYDGGVSAGRQLLVFATPNPDPVFLYVYDALGWVMANAASANAVPFCLSDAGNGTVSWQRWYGGNWQTASYQVDAQFTGLVFPLVARPPTGASLVTLQQSLITPSLAAIQAGKNAVGYDFQGVDLTGASLAGVNCSGANFTNAVLAGADFTGATLTDAVFAATDLTAVTFGANVQAAGAIFDGCIARNVVFPTEAKQPGGQADFTGASFVGADFSGADLTGANLSSALLYDADFSGAKLGGASLAGVLAGQSPTGENLGVDLTCAYMPDANLREAHLEGADLSHAQIYYLAEGALDSAFLVDTNLAGADLSGMSFKATTIVGTNFDDAILIGCTFNAVAFGPSDHNNPVSMVGAHLEGAQFIGTTAFTEAHLSDAYVALADGVPLFATPMLSGYATALDALTVPAGLAAIFAGFGYLLAAAATVAKGASSGQWILSQNPTIPTLGAEITGYTLVSGGTALAVYASTVALTEQGDAGTFNFPVGVTPTALTAAMLDGATRCPNHAMAATNAALALTWEQMLTAPRPPLATLAGRAALAGALGRTRRTT